MMSRLIYCNDNFTAIFMKCILFAFRFCATLLLFSLRVVFFAAAFVALHQEETLISSARAAQKGKPENTEAPGKTLVYCSAAGPKGFDPQLYIDHTTFDASARTIYDRLLAFQPGATRVVPALAESWEVSENGRIYTFKLRPDVFFHTTPYFTPGRPLNADDVVFSFERQWNKRHPYHAVSGARYEYFTGMGLQRLLAAVEKVDELSVQFTLKRPQASFLAILAMDFASILSAEYALKLLAAGRQELLDRQPVGTGPFVFTDYQRNARVSFRAHEQYWAGRSPLDILEFAIMPDFSQRWQKLRDGECHVLGQEKWADLQELRKRRSIRILQKPGLDIAYLAFNTREPPFTDRRIRLALTLAVNKELLVETVYQGAGIAAKNPLPPTVWAHHEKLADHPYDPEKARQLLVEAGLPDGFNTALWVMPVARLYNPDAGKMASLIKADWAKIGVNAELIHYPWREFLHRSRKAEHATIMLGWTGDNGDPDNFLSALLSCDAVKGANRAQWCSSAFEDLLRRARLTDAIEERETYYHQAQELFHEQLPWIVLAHSLRFQPVRREVSGFTMDAFGGNSFYGVDLKK